MPASESSNSNRALERIAAILDAVADTRASASELARRTGLSVSTVHRLALSMVDYGFLRRTASGEFELGPRFVGSALELAAAQVLAELGESTGETAQLWVRRGADRVCLVSVDSRHELKATLPVGSHLALPAGSSGRILAKDPAALDELHDTGWVESVGQRTPGLGSVSAPVAVDGETVAAVCLALPLSRVEVSPGRDYGTAVVRAAEDVSRRLAGGPAETGRSA